MRLRAWWSRNHPDRRSSSQEPAASDTATAEHWSIEQRDDQLESSVNPDEQNMEILLTLLSGEKEEDQLLRAELHRQLGRCGQAKEILRHLSVPGARIRNLIDLCDRKDRRIMQVAENNWFAPDRRVRRYKPWRLGPS